MSVTYTDPDLVRNVLVDQQAPRNPYAGGYGRKIPTACRVQYGDDARWRRVYVMQFSNAGSAYIVVNGNELFLDTDTEYRLLKAVTE